MPFCVGVCESHSFVDHTQELSFLCLLGSMTNFSSAPLTAVMTATLRFPTDRCPTTWGQVSHHEGALNPPETLVSPPHLADSPPGFGDTAEGYIDDFHFLTPTGSIDTQVLYLSIADGSVVPFAAMAVLLNP